MNPIEDVPIPIVELLNLFSINLISYSVSYGSSGVNLKKVSPKSSVSKLKSPYCSSFSVVKPRPTFTKDCFSKTSLLLLTESFKNTILVNWTWSFPLTSLTLKI